MIDHNIMGLDISVHYALAVTEIQSLDMFSNSPSCPLFRKAYLQELVDIIPNIIVDELGIETPEIGIVYVLENEGRRFALR
jgi:hypothetical protein